MQLTDSKTSTGAPVVLTHTKDIEYLKHSAHVEKILDAADDVIEALSQERDQERYKRQRAERSAYHWQAAFWIVLSALAGCGIVGGLCWWILK